MAFDEALHAVTTYGPGAGSARVRVFEWLSRLDLDSTVHCYLGNSSNSLSSLLRSPLSVLKAEAALRDLRGQLRASTVLISRQASPLSRGEIERTLLRAGAKGIYDFDDALYLDDRRPFSKSRIWRSAVRSADVVIAGNSVLADAANTYSHNVVELPSCVDVAEYQQKRCYDLASPPCAVWIGSPSTEYYLGRVASALLRYHRSHGLRLTVVSGGSRSLGSLDQMVDRVAWSMSSFPRHLIQADFGLMPLSDTPWSRGKCAYKLLQYGAVALPMIGSPVGVNATVLAQASGLAPSSEGEWVDAIGQLLAESSIEREARGLAAFQAVASGYTFDVWAPTWHAVLGS